MPTNARFSANRLTVTRTAKSQDGGLLLYWSNMRKLFFNIEMIYKAWQLKLLTKKLEKMRLSVFG